MTGPVPSASRRLFEHEFGPQSKLAGGRKTRVLALPDRLDDTALGTDSVQVVRNERPDAIFLTQPNATNLITSALPPGLAAIVPVVDASLSRGRSSDGRSVRADLQIAAPDRGGIADALAMLAPVIERVRSLHTGVVYSDDPRMVLLARLVVRDRGMEPRRTPDARETVIYEDESAIAGAARRAEELVALGLLHRQFSDMLTICPRCESGRLCARERCPACGSAQLVEEPIFHHLRCAYQAPEHEFRGEHGFVCPKCRASLLHFSVDYDRPGSVSICRACGRASSETSVGFVCLDCGAESDAAETGTREIHRYEITKAAHQCVLNASPLPPHNARFDDIAVRIRNFVARRAAAGEQFSILTAEMETSREQSPSRSSRMTYSLFTSLMRETFTADTEIIDAAPRFFALLANDEKAEVERALPEIRRTLEQFLSTTTAIHYRVYGPQEVEMIFGSPHPVS